MILPGALAAGWLEGFYQRRFLGNNALQWAGLFAVLLASFAVGKVVAFALDRQSRRLSDAGRLWVVSLLLRSLADPAKLLVLAGGLHVAGQFLTLREVVEGQVVFDVSDFWNQVAGTVAILAAGWFIYRLVDIIEHFLQRWTSRTETQLDDQLVPLIRKALRVVVVIMVVLFIARNVFQWDIGALVAGLGIGGLAFALAAQHMLSNFFGSVTIFADRPFGVGDRIIVKGVDGVVQEVGFRSTRIRTLTGHLVTMPNSVVAQEPVENVGRRQSIRRVLDVTIAYDTPPEKVQRGVEIIRQMLAARMQHFPPDYPPRVYFNDFNAASLNIVVYYWFAPPDWWQYLQFTHEFNMELLRRFNEEGIEFAFPTQTLYLKQGSPVSADVRLGQGSPPQHP